MTKSERINKLVELAGAEGIELKKTSAETILNIVDGMQVDELMEKGVATTPYGNVKIAYRNAREGRNIRTKEIIQIPERLAITLSTSKAIKDRLATIDIEPYRKNK